MITQKIIKQEWAQGRMDWQNTFLYYPLNFVLALVAGLSAQSALAICPIVDNANTIVRLNSTIDIDGRTIYFCKQDFANSLLSFEPSETQLVTGGSQVISQGNTIQSVPISNRTVDLAGFSPNALNFNALSSNFPTSGGNYDIMSLFNFYTRIPSFSSCNDYFGQDQFDTIINYLKANPNTFNASSQGQSVTAVASNTGNNIAKIDNMVISHDTLSGSAITSDITFYHANAGRTGQWFTRSPYRYCWVGVSTKMDIDTNNSNLKNSGNYSVTVSVLTP